MSPSPENRHAICVLYCYRVAGHFLMLAVLTLIAISTPNTGNPPLRDLTRASISKVLHEKPCSRRIEPSKLFCLRKNKASSISAALTAPLLPHKWSSSVWDTSLMRGGGTKTYGAGGACRVTGSNIPECSFFWVTSNMLSMMGERMKLPG